MKHFAKHFAFALVIFILLVGVCTADQAVTLTIETGVTGNQIPFNAPPQYQDSSGWYIYQQLIPSRLITSVLPGKSSGRLVQILAIGFAPAESGQVLLDAVEIKMAATTMSVPTSDFTSNLGTNAQTVFLGPVNQNVTPNFPFWFDLQKNGDPPILDMYNNNLLVQIRTKNSRNLGLMKLGAWIPGVWRVYAPTVGDSPQSPLAEQDGLTMVFVVKTVNPNKQ